jgi:hypothetical protein
MKDPKWKKPSQNITKMKSKIISIVFLQKNILMTNLKEKKMAKYIIKVELNNRKKKLMIDKSRRWEKLHQRRIYKRAYIMQRNHPSDIDKVMEKYILLMFQAIIKIIRAINKYRRDYIQIKILFQLNQLVGFKIGKI